MTKSSFFRVSLGIFSTAAVLLFSTITTFAKHSTYPNALYLLTSKDTPQAQTLLPGKIDLDAFHFDLYSRPHEGAIIKKIDLQIFGTADFSKDLANFKLYDENSKELIATSAVAIDGHVIFSNLSVSLKNKKPKKFSLQVDMTNNIPMAGATFSFSIDSIKGIGSLSGNDLKLNKVKNWSSNLFTILGISSSGSLTLVPGTSALHVLSGQVQQIFGFNLKTGPEEEILVKNLTIKCSNSCNDIEWLKVIPSVESGLLGSNPAYLSAENLVKFYFNPPLKLKKDTMTSFQVEGKIASVTSISNKGIPENVIKLSINNDVEAMGAGSANKITLKNDYSGSWASIVLSLTAYSQPLEKKFLAKGSQDQVVMKFTVKNYGPSSAIVKQISFGSVFNGPNNTLTDFIIRDAVTKKELTAASNPVLGVVANSFTEGADIEPGIERTFEIIADVAQGFIAPNSTAQLISLKIDAKDNLSDKSILFDGNIDGPTFIIE